MAAVRKSSPRKTVRRAHAPASMPQTSMANQYMPQFPQQKNGPMMLLVALLVGLAFVRGFLFNKVRNLENNKGTNTANQLDAQQPARPTELKIEKPSKDEHWRGSKDAKFVMVEYSDLECPFCKQAHPTIAKMLANNEGQVAWIFRHYPLSFHPKAQKSAEAVECAADQGGDEAFWRMVDAVYEKMPDLELSELPDLASAQGLDGTALKSCLDSDKYAKKVKQQQEEGTKAGVQATPSTVVYNTSTGKNLLIEGAVPEDQFATQLKDFMKK